MATTIGGLVWWLGGSELPSPFRIPNHGLKPPVRGYLILLADLETTSGTQKSTISDSISRLL